MAATHFFSSEFFAGEFFYGATPTSTTGGHFAGRRKHAREEDVSHSREARDKLRSAIRVAIDGPEYISEAVAAALEPFTTPQATDARFVPLDERIDWNRLTSRLAEIDRILANAIRAAEDDDDEDFLLLNG